MSVNRKVTVPLVIGSVAVMIRASVQASVVLGFGQLAQSTSKLAQDCHGDAWLFSDHGLEVPAGEGEAGRRLGADHLGNPGPSIEYGELAEEFTGAQVGDRFAVTDHP